MKEIDFNRCIRHDSAKELFRSPMGAVPTGTRVTLKMMIRDFQCRGAYLVVLRDQVKIEVEMREEGGMWVAEYDTPPTPTVLWYWFCIQLDEHNKIYYGTASNCACGMGKVYWNTPPAFQLTVYDAAFTTPDWFKGANMYQIFPDRYRRGDVEGAKEGLAYHKKLGRDVIFHEIWEEAPIYQPIEGKRFYQPCDYYGGDLLGIMESLNYLQEMGVSVLYLNPIFEAASNHRYNTGDYLKIDPVLGTNEDFKRLTQEAQVRGIKVILDGVFSHTGDDSVYFNRYGRYNSVGAYQSKDSPYYHWYQFNHYPDEYKSWWGFESLPEVDEIQPDWVDFIIEKDGSVIDTWLEAGAAGYRLDVADELPDETIEKIRAKIKHQEQENVLLGEVWEDATTKQSYGKNRTYALGRGLDSVMNYPFANETIAFLTGKKDAYQYKCFLLGQSQNYPKEMYYCLMNLLSSHDIARVRTILGTNIDAHSLSREQQAHFVITKEQDEKGAALQKAAAAIQFSIPGVPSIYYGDESGMNGLLDPFNRLPYSQPDKEMVEYYKRLANLRKENDALKTGDCVFYAHCEDIFGILRFCMNGTDAFGNMAKDGMFLTAANRSQETKKFVIDLFADMQMLAQEQRDFFQNIDFQYGHGTLSGQDYPIREGLIEVELPPQSADMIEVLWV